MSGLRKDDPPTPGTIVDETEPEKAAIIPYRDRSLLLVEFPSVGNCGEYIVSVFGRLSEGRRRSLGDLPCTLDNLTYRLTPDGLPEFIFQNALTDTVSTYSKNDWTNGSIVEDIKSPKWERMDRYNIYKLYKLKKIVGTKNIYKFIRTREIYNVLKPRFGTDWGLFPAGLQSGDLEFVSDNGLGFLRLTSSIRHSVVSSYVSISIENGALLAWLSSDKELKIYSSYPKGDSFHRDNQRELDDELKLAKSDGRKVIWLKRTSTE